MQLYYTLKLSCGDVDLRTITRAVTIYRRIPQRLVSVLRALRSKKGGRPF